MKKALAHIPTPRSTRAPFPFPARLVGVLALLGLIAAVGLFASRPARSGGGPVPVSVANTVQNHDVDNPARQPFQTFLQPSSDTTGRVSQSFTVPAHKRLVIEFVSAEVNQFPAGGGGYSYLETTAGGSTVSYYLANTFESPARRTQVVRLYADPGTPVTVGANNYGGSGIGTDTEISGYYVDVP